MRVAVSGSAGSGKSSLTAHLAKALNLPIISEQYDLFFEETGRHISPPTRLREKVEWLLEEKNLQEIEAGHFISDRCPIDLFNLWMTRGFNANTSATEAFQTKCQNYLQKYDYLVLLPWGDIPLVQVNDKNSNRRRSLKPWVQFRHHSTIIGVAMQWLPLKKILAVPKGLADVTDRTNFVIERLANVSVD